MKMTNSIDGKQRTSFSISYRLTVEELATYYVASEFTEVYGDDSCLNNLREMKQQFFMNIVKDFLHSEGVVSADYRVGDNNLGEELETAIEIINNKGWF